MSWVSEFLGQDAKKEAASAGRSAQEYATQQGLDAMRSTVEQGNEELGRGFIKARGALEGGQDMANLALRTRFGEAQDTLEDTLKMQRGDFSPYRQAGAQALAGLQSPSAVLANFKGDPGYQFRLKEGMNAIDSNMSAKGMLNSGARLKALQKFGQGLASEEYGKAYDRNVSRLNTIAGLGMQGAQGAAGAAGQYGANSANLSSSLGQGLAGNYMNTGTNLASNFQNLSQLRSGNVIGLGKDSANLMTGLGNAQAASYAAGATSPLQALQSIAGVAGDLGKGAEGASAAYLAFSDARLKTDVAPIKKSELAEMKRHLKAVYFNYKNDEHGDGRWAGVMAQDLEKSPLGRKLVTENSLGQKMVDMKKVLSMFLATMALEV